MNPTTLLHVHVQDDKTADKLVREMSKLGIKGDPCYSFGQGDAIVLVTVPEGESLDTKQFETPIKSVEEVHVQPAAEQPDTVREDGA
jgi:hypothetical protein